MKLFSRLSSAWWAMSLTQQFCALSVLVIGSSMLAIGLWVEDEISELVIQNSASQTAIYIDSFVEPLCQDLVDGPHLSEQSTERLHYLLSETPLGRRIPVIKIWNRDGVVLYSNIGEVTGHKFELTHSLRGAFSGRVVAEFDDLSDEENEAERRLKMSLLEVYSPIHAIGSDKVIAVAEFYEVADGLKADLLSVRLKTWRVVGLVCLGMIATLFIIVHQGNRTIVAQSGKLKSQIVELKSLLDENQTLRRTVDDAHRRAAQTTEEFMKRVGHELHDGPAQLIGLAMLRMEDLFDDHDQEKQKPFDFVTGFLRQAMTDLRTLAAGLAPPELAGLTVRDALLLAASNHEHRTRTTVVCDLADGLPALPPLLTTCIYRVAQEALNNAYKHAGGRNQVVKATIGEEGLRVMISDGGEGFASTGPRGDVIKLGVSIMRDRVESLGGRFTVTSSAGAGTIVEALFPPSAIRSGMTVPAARSALERSRPTGTLVA